MTQRKSGHIVGVTSAAGRVGLPIVSSYSASKFALCGLLEAIRPEVSSSSAQEEQEMEYNKLY